MKYFLGLLFSLALVSNAYADEEYQPCVYKLGSTVVETQADANHPLCIQIQTLAAIFGNYFSDAISGINSEPIIKSLRDQVAIIARERNEAQKLYNDLAETSSKEIEALEKEISRLKKKLRKVRG